MNDQPRPVPSDFGSLLGSSNYSAVGHYIGAAFIFFSTSGVFTWVLLFTKQNPGVSPYSNQEKAVMVAVVLLIAAVPALALVMMGRRRRNLMEAYEHGLRFVSPRGVESVFRYSEVKEMRRQAQASGALISVTFILATGQSHTASVGNSKDVRLLNEVMARFGPIEWADDNRFRIL